MDAIQQAIAAVERGQRAQKAVAEAAARKRKKEQIMARPPRAPARRGRVPPPARTRNCRRPPTPPLTHFA